MAWQVSWEVEREEGREGTRQEAETSSTKLYYYVADRECEQILVVIRDRTVIDVLKFLKEKAKDLHDALVSKIIHVYEAEDIMTIKTDDKVIYVSTEPFVVVETEGMEVLEPKEIEIPKEMFDKVLNILSTLESHQ